MPSVESTMRLDQLLIGNACLSLQGVDVLRVVPQEEPLLLEQSDKVVARSRGEFSWVELFCEQEEWLGIVAEKPAKHLHCKHFFLLDPHLI